MGNLCPKNQRTEEDGEEDGDFFTDLEHGTGEHGTGELRNSVHAIELAKAVQSSAIVDDDSLRDFQHLVGHSDNTSPESQPEKKLKEEQPKFSEAEWTQRCQGLIDADPNSYNPITQAETKCWLIRVGFSFSGRRYSPQTSVTVANM